MTSSNETELAAQTDEQLRSTVGRYFEPLIDGRGVRIGIACGRFNGGITTRLLEACLSALVDAGVDRRDITLAWVPGAFEIPLLAQTMIKAGTVDAVITLGAVIRGDTGHYEVVAGECARGVQDVQLASGVPVVFGVLTTNTIDQALERSLPDESNKGRESAHTALEMISVLRRASLGA
jgi:6,7-dimethyl-8-ribityllumazine synthase